MQFEPLDKRVSRPEPGEYICWEPHVLLIEDEGMALGVVAFRANGDVADCGIGAEIKENITFNAQGKNFAALTASAEIHLQEIFNKDTVRVRRLNQDGHVHFGKFKHGLEDMTYVPVCGDARSGQATTRIPKDVNCVKCLRVVRDLPDIDPVAERGEARLSHLSIVPARSVKHVRCPDCGAVKDVDGVVLEQVLGNRAGKVRLGCGCLIRTTRLIDERWRITDIG